MLDIRDTTYAGEAAANFILRAITGADTVDGGHLMVKDGIKKKYTIPRLDVNDIIQKRAATPTSQGEIGIDGRVLEPQDYMIYLEFNPRDFEDHWHAVQLNERLLDRSLPVTAEATIARRILQEHAKFLDRAIWQGDKDVEGPLDKFDGFIKKLKEADDTILVDSPVVLTAGNIASKLEACYLVIPDAVRYKDNLKFFVSYKTYRLYEEFQAAQVYKGVDVTTAGRPFYKGIPVVKIAGMPDDHIVVGVGTASLESNFWLGLNSKDDENMIQLARLQANSELWFFKMLMKADVNVGFDDEVVLYAV